MACGKEFLQVRQKPFHLRAAYIVNSAELCRVILCAADAEGIGRPDDEGVAGEFLLADVSCLLIVTDMAHFHSLDHIGILTHGKVNERQRAALFFYITERRSMLARGMLSVMPPSRSL